MNGNCPTCGIKTTFSGGAIGDLINCDTCGAVYYERQLKHWLSRRKEYRGHSRERNLEIHRRRRRGQTFTQIAKDFDMTPSNARGIYMREQRRIEREQTPR